VIESVFRDTLALAGTVARREIAMPESALEELIRELEEAKRKYDRLLLNEERPNTLGPPAGAAQLAELEQRLGYPLPPSYRAFLELHNGWDNFAGGSKLLAVEDHGREWVRERIAFWDALIEDDSVNPFWCGCLPVLFGEDENHFLVMDPRTVREEGEMDFIDFDYAREFKRYATFTDFLREDLEIMRNLIAGHGDSVRSDQTE
jgi:hypothetical protein